MKDMLAMAPAAAAARRSIFGSLPDSRTVEAITLTSGAGMSVTIISYGATVQAVSVPDRDGTIADVALGHAEIDGYLAARNYLGATVGRYANRIKGGRFVIDGHEYALAINDGPNTLHGGVAGFDRQLWTVENVTEGSTPSVTLSHVSADGEEGFPGALTVTATYTLNDRNELSVEYTATTTRPTIVNITNHSFFNLAGEASQTTVYDHILTVPADSTTPVDRTLIPTGELRAVDDTPFDFRVPTAIGARIGDESDPQIVFGQGYDENFVIARDVARHPRLHARVEHPSSGRTLDILSNQPGVQLYTGNNLDGTAIGKAGNAYLKGHGLALEPQLFPDTPNQPAFSSARLDPGETYRHVIVYRFGTS